MYFSRTRARAIQDWIESQIEGKELPEWLTPKGVQEYFKLAEQGILLEALEGLGPGWGIHHTDSCHNAGCPTGVWCGCSVVEHGFYLMKDDKIHYKYHRSAKKAMDWTLLEQGKPPL